MSVTVKNIVLWKKEVENGIGILAQNLEPVARAGADLHVVMAYRYTGDKTKAEIELYSITGRKSIAAAQKTGFSAASSRTLLVEGDNKPGLGYAIAQAIAGAGVNVSFFVAQVIGRKYSAVIGFEADADAKNAATLIKKATVSKKK